MLPAQYRLKDKSDFRRVYQRGKAQAYPSFVLYCRRTNLPNFRVGFSVSKKLGKAVQRNRIKRRFRELCRLMPEQFAPRADYVFIVRTAAAAMPREKLAGQIQKALSQVRI